MTTPRELAARHSDSPRIEDADVRARDRLRRQREILRPLGWTIVLVVIVSAAFGHPAPGVRGVGLGILLSAIAFGVSVSFAISNQFITRHIVVQTVDIAVMGGTGVALAALQPQSAAILAGGAAVFMAITRLPLWNGVVLAASLTAALDIATSLSGNSTATVLSATLTCGLLGVVAHFLRQGRESQAYTERLLAELEDAHDEQARAAAIAERGRIATELHDVLAHSLSGAAIQLQAARLLADREHAGQRLRDAIDRAGELVRGGLVNAKEAVGALRGASVPGVEQLQTLIDSVSADFGLHVTLQIHGDARTVSAESGLALYRSVQEALTNVARHAGGATVAVVLRYDGEDVSVSIQDGGGSEGVAADIGGDLRNVGGGRGLAGLQDRIERLGGRMNAGPKDGGWRVDVEVPA